MGGSRIPPWLDAEPRTIPAEEESTDSRKGRKARTKPGQPIRGGLQIGIAVEVAVVGVEDESTLGEERKRAEDVQEQDGCQALIGRQPLSLHCI